MLLFEFDARHLAEQPAAQRPRAVILAGDCEDGFGHVGQISQIARFFNWLYAGIDRNAAA
jgi:hypothetical protein